MSRARPMPPRWRETVYLRGRRTLTPTQRRRVRHKAGRAARRDRRRAR